ncbi:hypothetical protein [Spirosoma terrae]|uniref:Uncharacterized protein n=1 Tax=Spirosoma terrae TaxID=1968276 RepID=A0A6L9LAM2_9BACT|nr:hypothetical protein [Spirosoma terrae]NDU96547.1 hypothetical protein [Spirosoma terrae]
MTNVSAFSSQPPKPLNQLFFLIAGNRNTDVVGHDQIRVFPFYKQFDVVEIDDVLPVNPQ